ncbi:unnamed protein product [Durusdinium trenchii]|uniref:Uncharacterized protein n=1 Tax=Durusdinium trenchii TaxID=1381693 RepID=A0ABP0H6A0_9DINO
MSTKASLAPLRAELLKVSEDLASIGERVKQLAQRLNELEGSANEDLEWEVIEEGNLPLGVSDLEFPYPGASQVPQAQPIPSVPRYLSDLCQERLKSVASTSPLERAQRAFTQGHLAWVARVTGLHYRPADAVPALPSAHFVVIRGLGLSQALRTTTKREALRALAVSKTGGNLQVFAIPVLQRDGGFLVALPVESFSNEALETAAHADEHELLGPSHTCVAQLSEEDENGQEVMIDQEILVLLVDAAVTYAEPAGGQSPGVSRHAYPQLPALGQGFAHLGHPKEATAKKVAAMVGPPPKTRKAPPAQGALALPDPFIPEEPRDLFPAQIETHPMLSALAQQSTALTTLVSHLAGHASDPLVDLQAGGLSGSSSSTRGVARRERMQTDLALRQSQYWLAFLQQLSRKMNPSKPVPTTEEAAKDAGLSFLAYLERHGAYKQSRELGTILWVLGYIIDAAIAQDFDGVKEHLALFAAALDQAALDQSWTTAFLVTLVEEPPPVLFAEKGTPLSVAKPFTPLMPAVWGGVLLAYLKDIDIMTSKKQEGGGRKTGQQTSQEQKDGEASPKRRPRFPKKPKGGGGQPDTGVSNEAGQLTGEAQPAPPVDKGLCIDDYFAMSLEQVGTPLQASKASQKIGAARAAYRQAELLGSPEKDILSDKAKIVGSEEFEGKEEVKPTSIRRPLAYRFDFIELFAGAAKVAHSMEAKGQKKDHMASILAIHKPIQAPRLPFVVCSALSWDGDTGHVVIEGKLTKASAMYTDGLADALATVLSEAINARASADLEWDQVQTAGLENALVNQVVEHLILKWGPQRAAILVDSNVVRPALISGWLCIPDELREAVKKTLPDCRVDARLFQPGFQPEQAEKGWAWRLLDALQTETQAVETGRDEGPRWVETEKAGAMPTTPVAPAAAPTPAAPVAAKAEATSAPVAQAVHAELPELPEAPPAPPEAPPEESPQSSPQSRRSSPQAPPPEAPPQSSAPSPHAPASPQRRGAASPAKAADGGGYAVYISGHERRCDSLIPRHSSPRSSGSYGDEEFDEDFEEESEVEE